MTEKRNEFIQNLRRQTPEKEDLSNLFWAARIESERLERERIAKNNEEKASNKQELILE